MKSCTLTLISLALAAPVLAATPSKTDDTPTELRARYSEAVSELSIEGCNEQGRIMYQLAGHVSTKSIQSGEDIKFDNGLTLTARASGFPACRVALYDGRHKVVELSE